MDVQKNEAFMAVTETPLPWKAEADRKEDAIFTAP